MFLYLVSLTTGKAPTLFRLYHRTTTPSMTGMEIRLPLSLPLIDWKFHSPADWKFRSPANWNRTENRLMPGVDSHSRPYT